jgi:ribose transport system ATP-binding protein
MYDKQGQRLLEMRGITKFFPGVRALNDVDLELNRGEIIAIIGENGAGKSTLVKILGGIYYPNTGKIILDGKEVVVDSVQTATNLGIAFVHQELNLSDNLDVGSNIFLGREPRKKNFFNLINQEKIYKDTEEILKRIDMRCSPYILLRDMAIGSQQMVEIAKSLSISAKILIMDEPTSSLSGHETVQLFKVLKELRSQGVSIIYISHRLGEVKEIADRVMVLRDGVVSGHLSREEISHDNMVRLMVGRDVEKFYRRKHVITKKPVFEVKDFIVPSKPNKRINFNIYKGEVLVLAGLVGAGRTEIAHALFGIDKPLSGKILLDGKTLKINNPQDAIQAGIGLVPEDRNLNGLIVEMAVEENITLVGLNHYQKMKMIQFKMVRSIAREMVKKLDIRLRNIYQAVETLSGGNQQKVVLAKWLSLKPKVMLLDEPARGIDVVAKEEIYRLIERLASQGVATLVISSEMQEVLGIADRILVVYDGEIKGELQKEQASEEAVISLATGGK